MVLKGFKMRENSFLFDLAVYFSYIITTVCATKHKTLYNLNTLYMLTSLFDSILGLLLPLVSVTVGNSLVA